MILSLVSITRGSSFLASDCFLRRTDGIVVLAKPAVPSAKLVITAPMSLNERKTPPSLVSCWPLDGVAVMKYSDGLAALSNMLRSVRVSRSKSLKL